VTFSTVFFAEGRRALLVAFQGLGAEHVATHAGDWVTAQVAKRSGADDQRLSSEIAATVGEGGPRLPAKGARCELAAVLSVHCKVSRAPQIVRMTTSEIAPCDFRISDLQREG